MKSKSVYTDFKSGKFYLTFHNLSKKTSYDANAKEEDKRYNFGGVFLNDEETISFREAINSTIIQGQHFFDLSKLKIEFDRKYSNLSMIEANSKWSECIVNNQEILLKSININPYFLKNTDKTYGDLNVPLSEKDSNFKNQWHFKVKNKNIIEFYSYSDNALNKILISEADKIFSQYCICIGTFTVSFSFSPNGKPYFGIYPKSLIKIKDADESFKKKENLNNKEDMLSYVKFKLGE